MDTLGHDETLLVPWPRVVSFVRQLSHDVRNGLNALDLESAFIAELNTDPEIAEEIVKLRAMVGGATSTLQGVSGAMSTYTLSPILLESKLLIEDLHAKVERRFPEETKTLKWTAEAGDDNVEVDVERFGEAMIEIFQNAFQFREKGKAPAFRSSISENHLRLEVIEEKSAPVDPTEWGTAPLVTTRRGGYGLGLFNARRIIAMHQGVWSARFDSKAAALVTRVSIPIKG